MGTPMSEGGAVRSTSSPDGTDTRLVVHVLCLSSNRGIGRYCLVNGSMGMDHRKVSLSLNVSDVTGITIVIDHRTRAQSQTSKQVGQLISVTNGLLLNRLRSDTLRHAAILQMAVATDNSGALSRVNSLGFLQNVMCSCRSLLTARHRRLVMLHRYSRARSKLRSEDILRNRLRSGSLGDGELGTS